MDAPACASHTMECEAKVKATQKEQEEEEKQLKRISSISRMKLMDFWAKRFSQHHIQCMAMRVTMRWKVERKCAVDGTVLANTTAITQYFVHKFKAYAFVGRFRPHIPPHICRLLNTRASYANAHHACVMLVAIAMCLWVHCSSATKIRASSE